MISPGTFVLFNIDTECYIEQVLEEYNYCIYGMLKLLHTICIIWQSGGICQNNNIIEALKPKNYRKILYYDT